MCAPRHPSPGSSAKVPNAGQSILGAKITRKASETQQGHFGPWRPEVLSQRCSQSRTLLLPPDGGGTGDPTKGRRVSGLPGVPSTDLRSLFQPVRQTQAHTDCPLLLLLLAKWPLRLLHLGGWGSGLSEQRGGTDGLRGGGALLSSPDRLADHPANQPPTPPGPPRPPGDRGQLFVPSLLCRSPCG